MVWGSGFSVQGLGVRVTGVEFWVKEALQVRIPRHTWRLVLGLELMVRDSGFRVWSSGVGWNQGSEFLGLGSVATTHPMTLLAPAREERLGCIRVWGSGLKV